MIVGRDISLQSAMLIPKEPLQNRRPRTFLLLPNSDWADPLKTVSGPYNTLLIRRISLQ
jgi:hypothetical protein